MYLTSFSFITVNIHKKTNNTLMWIQLEILYYLISSLFIIWFLLVPEWHLGVKSPTGYKMQPGDPYIQNVAGLPVSPVADELLPISTGQSTERKACLLRFLWPAGERTQDSCSWLESQLENWNCFHHTMSSIGFEVILGFDSVRGLGVALGIRKAFWPHPPCTTFTGSEGQGMSGK